jgi:integrase
MTGLQRSAYSFRHYFATKLIELGLSVPQVADWLGTSSQMVEKHYNRFLTERNAHRVNGYDLLRAQIDRQIKETRRAPWDADTDADADWPTEEEPG